MVASQAENEVKTGAALKTVDSWSLPIRMLCIGVVATVTVQLALSLMMESPDEENILALASATSEAHEVIGMVALVIVLAHWLWALFSQADVGLMNHPHCLVRRA